ncbi:MAG: ice-binding family protein [Bacteroidales bacterium]|nr:ice-binding family protein [Bacteroidales bacterium]
MKKILLFLFTFSIWYASFGQTPNLGSTSNFVLFTAAGAFTNTGSSIVTGDIGTHVGALTGFPPGTVIGGTFVADPTTAQAAADVAVAYTSLNGAGTVIGTTLGNGQILTAGTYTTGAASTLNGNLIFDGQNNANSQFVVRIGGAFATNVNSTITLINGASLCNIYWQIGGAFTLGDNSVFRGTVIASGQIELLAGSSLIGRGLTTAGAILLHNNIVTIPSTPIAAAGPDRAICLNETTQIGAAAVAGSSYSWTSVPAGFTSTTANPTVAPLVTTTYTVVETITATGCTNSNSVVVTVNPLPNTSLIFHF